MKCQSAQEIPLRPVELEGAVGVSMRWLISQKEAPNFAMRLFEVAKGGHTPLHTHPSEHEVFILEGQGELTYEKEHRSDRESDHSSGRDSGHSSSGSDSNHYPFQAGHVIFVEPNKLHQFRNIGPGTMKFLCLIPRS